MSMTEVHSPAPDRPVEPPPPPRTTSLTQLILVKIPHVICGVLLLAAIAINITNVVGRYVFSAPLNWAEEAMIYILVWGVFICIGSVTYQGLHLRMDLLVMTLRGRAKMLLGGLTVVMMIACAIFVMLQTSKIVQLYISNGETSMGAKVPLVYPHSALLVGFFLMVVAALIRFRSYLTGKFD
jgi:TRAP-type C4-dicarboxylate transport system permease small subunit